MATVLCHYSGIEFKTEHFPIHLTQGEACHPIFDVPLKRLWKYFPKWQSGELTEVDSYLYFISLLNATEMVDFRCPVFRTANTPKIIQSNMENLYYTIGKIVAIKHPAFVIPRFVVSPDTRTLENVRYWIQTWSECYADFSNGLQDQELRARLVRKAQGLERLIKNPALHPSKYAKLLAAWCADAAEFPEFEFIDPMGNRTTLSEYWQEIIIKCHTNTAIITVPEKDLTELIEHCETNLDGGSIQSHHLFETIRLGLDTLQGFFSIGSPTFSILNEGDDVGTSNLQLLIDSAPLSMPKRTEYPSDFAFIKAKMKYSLALQASTSTESTNSIEGKL